MMLTGNCNKLYIFWCAFSSMSDSIVECIEINLLKVVENEEKGKPVFGLRFGIGDGDRNPDSFLFSRILFFFSYFIAILVVV